MTNVALVVLDTLRKDSFDEHFDWLPGVRFENAWSTSHWTVPAHASLFTGQYASEVGVYAGAKSLDVETPVLAERLAESGYTTRAFSGNVNVSKQFQYNRGFDQFEGSWRLEALEENVFNWDGFISRTQDEGPTRYLRALWACVTEDCETVPSLRRGALLKLRDLGIGTETRDDGAHSALELVRETEFGENEFFFCNLMEAHTPYDAPEEYRTVESPDVRGLEMTLTGFDGDGDAIRQAYADEVRYLSDMYRRIFDELRRDFDVVVTVSDHGEMLGEDGIWEHLYGLYPPLTHVPLTVWTGEDGRSSRDDCVSLLDVHATVLAQAGLDTGGSRGRDLCSELDDREWLTEYHGISEGRHRSLESQGIDDVDFLDQWLTGFVSGPYYFHETYDGHEAYGPPPYDDPAGHLDEMVSGIERRRVSEDEEMSASVRQQLEDLGYV